MRRSRRSMCASVKVRRMGLPIRAWRRPQAARDEEALKAMPKLKVVMSQDEDEPDRAPERRAEELRLLEAMLFASAVPLDEKELAARLPQGVDVRAALVRLQQDYAARGVNLMRVNGKWMFRTANDLSWL